MKYYEAYEAHLRGEIVECRKHGYGWYLPSWGASVSVMAELEYRLVTPPKKRLMTPIELAGKWVLPPDFSSSWQLVIEVNKNYAFISTVEKGFEIKTLQVNGWKWADHPSAEVHDSFEVEL